MSTDHNTFSIALKLIRSPLVGLFEMFRKILQQKDVIERQYIQQTFSFLFRFNIMGVCIATPVILN